MSLEPSELILNADRSVYHLNLRPGDLAETIILVGDPERVPQVSRHFDSVEFSVSKREFTTHTGTLGKQRLSVVSTGIGTDNIDIVLNEIDALFNIDFETRQPRATTTRLRLVRIGTSGALQKDIPVDSFVISEYAIGFDGLLHYYDSEHLQRADIQYRFLEAMQWSVMKAVPYVVTPDPGLTDLLSTSEVIRGMTATNPGFYAPQGRRLRLPLQQPDWLARMAEFRFGDLRITNMEMETAGILGLAGLLGHQAASLSAILANRANGEFSEDPSRTIDRLITRTLEILV
ncbi:MULTISPECIES: nucleoside phosphorylase [Robiginitalea]|uniref:nucleoside phosphorylase n=1 Tax=Robiginitalea TaxID=252306 RepID=UPI002349C5D6|nr:MULTISPECIES: nucleoside phosphorylase [unclassified Robiginitalea]MDC6354016.1 nucleoside phosphorylase [Robiginitalea sp. PM2]MDC6374283.1 nucleoside phosphorylase [Robiginitalea sp. SP8]